MNDLLEDIRKHLLQYDKEVYKAAAFGFTLKPDDSILLLREVYNTRGFTEMNKNLMIDIVLDRLRAAHYEIRKYSNPVGEETDRWNKIISQLETTMDFLRQGRYV